MYHLTDVPSFVSGRHVVYFDPHATFLPNVSSSNPGKRVDFVKNDVFQKNRDQFAPFLAFGCDARSEFRGTTFRFPLRTKAQADNSKLSKASYGTDDVRRLLRDFADEAVLDMLFLKSVAAVEISAWRRRRRADDALRREVATDAIASRSLVSARGAFARASAARRERRGGEDRARVASRFELASELFGVGDERRGSARLGAPSSSRRRWALSRCVRSSRRAAKSSGCGSCRGRRSPRNSRRKRPPKRSPRRTRTLSRPPRENIRANRPGARFVSCPCPRARACPCTSTRSSSFPVIGATCGTAGTCRAAAPRAASGTERCSRRWFPRATWRSCWRSNTKSIAASAAY